MHIDLDDDEKFTLTLYEIRALLAIAEGPTTGYDLAKICAIDLGRTKPLSQGTVIPLLKRLQQAYLIHQVEPSRALPNPGKPEVLYRLTSAGEFVLESEINNLRRIVHLAEIRLPLLKSPNMGSRARARYQTL